MLEHSGNLQPGQVAAGAQAVHAALKVSTQIKSDAAHAGIGLQVPFHSHTGPTGCCGQRLGVFQTEYRLGNLFVRQNGGLVGLSHAKHQDGLLHPAPAQVKGLSQAGDREPFYTLLGQRAGNDSVTVAIGVGLDDGADGCAAQL